MTDSAAPADKTTYQRLAEPFDHTFTDVRGGVELTYISGEQVATRLNEVLGVEGWSFRIINHSINADADEAWVMGEIVADIDGKLVTRQQFGSQKLKRSRSTGSVLDIGFDLKGAATDAMKKCASLLGVGLYLSRKEQTTRPTAPRQTRPPVQQAATQQAPRPIRQEPASAARCSECNEALKPVNFKDGTAWDVAELTSHSKRKHGRALCFNHYKAASDANRA